MGCLLGCFGLSSKRKRRKLPSRILPRDHGFGSYQQLDSSAVSINLDSEQRKLKEPLNSKIRKKVRFNLNVKAYEPIPSNNFWEGDDGEEEDDKATERGKTLEPSSLPMDITSSYPSNYRYRNCIYSHDDEEEEEEEYLYDDSDLDSDEDYLYEEEEPEDDQHNDIEELRRRRRRGTDEEEQVSQRFSSLKVSPNSGIDSKDEGRSRWPEITDHQHSAREKNQYLHSVLNPVENLAQWKEVKAKSKQQPEKRQMKENADVQLIQKHIMLPVQELAVDSSLANWLVSPATCHTKSCASSCPRREERLGTTEMLKMRSDRFM